MQREKLHEKKQRCVKERKEIIHEKGRHVKYGNTILSTSIIVNKKERNRFLTRPLMIRIGQMIQICFKNMKKKKNKKTASCRERDFEGKG